MAPPRKSKLPKPLPDGFILTDTEKKKWRLGKIIGQGGFGLIYLASQDVKKPVSADTNFVIKLEYQENGPLFMELKFYQRAAKPESMQKWMRSRKLNFLGIPTYWGSGLAEHNDLRYRFMAMDRLGSDLQKVCENNGGRLKKASVLQFGEGLVDVLEYIHENEYVHADIKAANLMLGYRDPEKLYLADYGLSYRYCPDGVHKEYKENPKKAHNGTIEYTSLDAHKGLAPSRRGDLQILGFCLLHWLCGSLPWESVLRDPEKVQESKSRLMDNLPDSVQKLSVNGANTDEVAAFLLHVKALQYDDKPNYQLLKDLLASVKRGSYEFSVPQGPVGESATKRAGPHTSEKTAEPGVRRCSKAKSVVTVKDEVWEGRKPAPKTRGSHLTEPQSQQRDKVAFTAVRRSPRDRPVQNYAEDDDNIEEEDINSPKPIPACFLRSPPTGTRAQSKQKSNSNKTSKKTGNLTVTSTMENVHQQRRKYMMTNCDMRNQTNVNYNVRTEYNHQQGSGSTQKNRLYGMGFFGVLFLMYFLFRVLPKTV